MVVIEKKKRTGILGMGVPEKGNESAELMFRIEQI